MSAEDGAPLADVPFIKAPMPDRRDFPREVRVGNEKCDYCGQPGIQFGDVLVCIDHAAKVDTHRYTPDVEVLMQQVAEFQWNALEISRRVEQAERRAEEAEFHVEQLRDARDSAERRAEDAEAAIEATRDLLDGWEHDGPDDYAVRLLVQRVREMLALGERFRTGRQVRHDA